MLLECVPNRLTWNTKTHRSRNTSKLLVTGIDLKVFWKAGVLKNTAITSLITFAPFLSLNSNWARAWSMDIPFICNQSVKINFRIYKYFLSLIQKILHKWHCYYKTKNTVLSLITISSMQYLTAKPNYKQPFPGQIHAHPQNSARKMLIKLWLNEVVKTNTAIKFCILSGTVQSTLCLPVWPDTTSFHCCILFPSDSDIFPKEKNKNNKQTKEKILKYE